jgi:ribosomal protein S12
VYGEHWAQVILLISSSPSIECMHIDERPGFHSYKLVRGASDLGGVANRVTARSRYGGERPILLSNDSRPFNVLRF